MSFPRKLARQRALTSHGCSHCMPTVRTEHAARSSSNLNYSTNITYVGTITSVIYQSQIGDQQYTSILLSETKLTQPISAIAAAE